MAGTGWPSLAAGRKAKASEVELRFDWIEGDIVPQTAGSSTDSVYYLGTASARWLGLYTKSINPTSTAGGVAIGTTTANASALLDLAGTKALLLPRLSSTQRDALTAVDGMLIFNSSLSQFQFYRGAWTNIGGQMYRTQPVAETTTTVFVTTTILSIASGGGRINGLSLNSVNVSSRPQLSVVIDGTTVFSWAAATAGAFHYVVRADGFVSRTAGTTTALGADCVFPAAPFIGWEFATSCAIYQCDIGSYTDTTHVAYSLAV